MVTYILHDILIDKQGKCTMSKKYKLETGSWFNSKGLTALKFSEERKRVRLRLIEESRYVGEG